MNVLFTIGYYPSIGGVEAITTNISNELVKMNYGVHILSFWKNCDLEMMGLDDRVNVGMFSTPVYSKRNIQFLHNYIISNNIDVILNQWCLPYFVTRLIKHARKGTNCKYVAVHQNMPTTNARIKNVEIDIENNKGIKFVNFIKWHAYNLASRLSLRYVYKNCDRFSLLSASFIPDAMKYIWENEGKKFISIPESFDSEADGTLPNKDKELLYLGRIDYNQKRVRRVIDIWNKLEKKYPDWHLTIVGDGPDMANVKQKVHDYCLQRVYFEGFQKSYKYFKRAPIMLLVSEYEGFGIVLAEAQSYGCVPVALDSYTALHDIVENGKNGIITSYPYSEDEFVNIISELIENEKLRKKMALNAISSVKKFELNVIVDKWLKLFADLKINL